MRWLIVVIVIALSCQTKAENEMINMLESIGYVEATGKDHDMAGVTVYDSSKAQNGLNFYCAERHRVAVLMNMRGNVINEWNSYGTHAWRKAYLFSNGDILAIQDTKRIVKYDWDGNIVWERMGCFHHDIEYVPENGIYTIMRVPHGNLTDDIILLMDENGKPLNGWSVRDALLKSKYSYLYTIEHRKGRDVLHTNSLDYYNGQMLISMRFINTIAIVDLRSGVVVWAYNGDLDGQHDAQIIPPGNILLFDNRWKTGRISIVKEFRLSTTMPSVWNYTAIDFYSKARGAAQRLENGNTLITESDRGRAFEVTHTGDIVWEYYNTDQTADSITVIQEMERIDHGYLTGR